MDLQVENTQRQQQVSRLEANFGFLQHRQQQEALEISELQSKLTEASSRVEYLEQILKASDGKLPVRCSILLLFQQLGAPRCAPI